jgi:hypothetical protein
MSSCGSEPSQVASPNYAPAFGVVFDDSARLCFPFPLQGTEAPGGGGHRSVSRESRGSPTGNTQFGRYDRERLKKNAFIRSHDPFRASHRQQPCCRPIDAASRPLSTSDPCSRHQRSCCQFWSYDESSRSRADYRAVHPPPAQDGRPAESTDVCTRADRFTGHSAHTAADDSFLCASRMDPHQWINQRSISPTWRCTK